MKPIVLKAGEIKKGKIHFVQANNGTIKLIGSARSPFFKGLNLQKDSLIQLTVKNIKEKKENGKKKK